MVSLDHGGRARDAERDHAGDAGSGEARPLPRAAGDPPRSLPAYCRIQPPPGPRRPPGGDAGHAVSAPARIARSHGGVIDELVAGTWRHPRTGERARIPIDNIVIAEALDGAEPDLIAPLHRGQALTVVADRFTW